MNILHSIRLMKASTSVPQKLCKTYKPIDPVNLVSTRQQQSAPEYRTSYSSTKVALFTKLFANLARTGNVDGKSTYIQTHSSPNMADRYQQLPRTTFFKLMFAQPGADKHLRLTISGKEMNGTFRTGVIFLSTLVFGEHPPLYSRSETPKRQPTLYKHAKVAEKVLQEIKQVMVRMRADRALLPAVPHAGNVTYEHNENVLT